MTINKLQQNKEFYWWMIAVLRHDILFDEDQCTALLEKGIKTEGKEQMDERRREEKKDEEEEDRED